MSNCNLPETRLGRLTVVNRHHKKPVPENTVRIYIGRGSVLGNPFKVQPYGEHERGESIALYRQHMMRALLTRDTSFRDEIGRIVRLLEGGTNVELECFCKPQACHGDVLHDTVLEFIIGDLAPRHD